MKVLSHFLKDPYNGFYLRELARKLEMDPMTVKRSLDLLLSDGYIERHEEKVMILYRGNMEEPHFTFMKVSRSLSLIRDSGIIDRILEEDPGTICIVLYGSVAKGEDGPESDLDLLVIGGSREMDLSDVDVPWEFNPIFMDMEEWEKSFGSNKPFHDEIVQTGIVLFGTMPVME
jgi:predicted nucleotidyltransferase